MVAALACLVGSAVTVLATPAPAGALTLNAAANYSTGVNGTDPRAVVVGDFNGDGKPDLAVADSGDGKGRSCSVPAAAPTGRPTNISSAALPRRLSRATSRATGSLTSPL
jgi:hypothetical protein